MRDHWEWLGFSCGKGVLTSAHQLMCGEKLYNLGGYKEGMFIQRRAHGGSLLLRHAWEILAAGTVFKCSKVLHNHGNPRNAYCQGLIAG